MEGKDFCCYEFGEFKLDPRRRALSKNGEKVPLPARNFDLLLFMVENDGRILEHDELLDKVWAGTFVEQATLKKGVSALRHILEEKPETEFIKTIPRRGYSFVSPVRIVPENNESYFIRETEQEIIVEEYEEIDEPAFESDARGKTIEISAVEVKALPAVKTEKISFARLIIAGFAGAAAFALTFFIWQQIFSKNVQSQFSVEHVRVNRITNGGKTPDAVISPDGSYLIYPVFEKDGSSLWLKQMMTGSASRLTPPVRGGFWGFAFAPDNNYVYYIFNNEAEPAKSGLYKLPLLGGEPRRIQENVASIAVSPDGKRIGLVRLTDKVYIFTLNPDGEDERAVSELPAGSTLLGISWTPDSAAIVCTIRKVVESKPLYYVSEISAESGSEKIVLPPQERNIIGAVWLPDKSAVLVTMREPNADIRQIWQFLPASQEWRRVTNDNNSYKYISLTRDGKNIVTGEESRLAAIWITSDLAIERKNPDKKSLLSNSDNFRQITDGVNGFDWLGWLGNDRILYSLTDDTKEMIYTIKADGTNPRQVTDGKDGIWIHPQAGGNGQSISFLSSRTGIRQVWRIDGNGENLTRMTQTDKPAFKAQILRDNSTVFYNTQQNTFVALFKQTADGQTTQITEANTGSFAVSPDETLLAIELENKNTGKDQVELRSVSDNKTIKTFDFTSRRELRFTPDGKNLAYDEMRDGVGQIMIQPLDGGEPFALTDFQTEEIFSFGWSLDGRRFAVVRGKQLSDAVLIKNADR